MQRWFRGVRAVEIPDEAADPGVERAVEHVPVEARVVVPLASLAELGAHEHQLLARVRVHEPVQHAQGGRLLPVVSRQLSEHRALAVHDLVVRERQDEVLRERVDQREGQVPVVVPAEDRILLHVLQGVVHPPHVPLVGEPETAEVRGTADRRPGRGLLGEGDRAWPLRVRERVHLAEEVDGVEILTPAEPVGQPLPFLA